ncbi:KUP system potassium uptake protein [Roseiarcus fermentans]|uniref:Probable potassium transport system protein Kup n=1 Tax=Roseiarcus fermentans TaxID=1473586 RepID=A0A366FC72_9HYPH|nr:KUP/HAK/KT family potassium transporter [Roseiarcus fermentans]RBP12241.1 KUP system potassium uptake protein [Roseiarcus fermentans]
MASETDTPQASSAGRTAVAGVAALGVVFGDIGTSPLYTLKTVLDYTGPHPDPSAVLGALSLIVWTLFLITAVKYVNFAMRVDNDGEGGIIALMTLLGVKKQRRPIIVAVGLFGAALIYGDGAITPAISVLSALEGVEQIAPALTAWVLPAAAVILVLLFAVQPFGTARIGRAFGPIMLFWFFAIAALGGYGILQHPYVIAAINPLWGLDYLMRGGVTGFLVLGGVFLCVTGAEALYADMGHFGVGPIRLSWWAVVFPALILNYAGQAAIVIAGAPTEGNIFYRLCPGPLLTPMILLATVATVIASQSIITGAYSMTRQAIQLGWLPRMTITQTSEEGYAQIYVGAVNWLLMIVTLLLTIGFGKSDRLAAAYGIAVSATMLMTSVLLFIAMREVWNWPVWAAGLIAAAFIAIDGSFLAANLAKLLDGGWVPLLLASLVYGVMWIWHRGATAVQARIEAAQTPLSAMDELLRSGRIARVPGSAVFLTRVRDKTPPVMDWHVRQNRALHQDVMALTLTTLSVPWTAPEGRVTVQHEADHFWRAEARIGFMERPDVPAILAECKRLGAGIDLDDVTFYVGAETIVPASDGAGLPRWQEALFAAMTRNAGRISDYLALPYDRVVEIGREIEV